MKNFLNHFKKLEWVLIFSTVLLIGLGLLSLYSSSVGKDDFSNFNKQIIFASIGLLLMFALSFFDWRVLKDNPYLVLVLYSICVLLLLSLFFFAPEIRGVQRWYKIGQISIDPMEFAKIVLIILLAKYFSMRHVEMYRVRHILLSGLYVFIPSVLIFFQPDLGSVFILIALWAGVLIISGIKLRHFLILCLCLFLVLALSWSFLLRDYQKDRVISFVQPQLVDPLESRWSQDQAKIAIGVGGFFGQGITKGSQTQHGFLPEPQTDFIFSAIAEELGLIGVFILLFLFSVLIWRIMKIAQTSFNNFSRLFATGFAILLTLQIFINIGMNIGLLPVIGTPLPLISYGGSSLIATLIGLGIIQSIKRY